MHRPVITLTRDELIHAAQGGCTRLIDGILKGRKHYFQSEDEWRHNVCGSMAEMAVAKYFGMFWFPTYDDLTTIPADVGDKIQVRSVKEANHHLPIRSTDPEDHAFVLVHYSVPRFTLLGWIYGNEAKTHDEWKRPQEGEKPPCWFVPANKLTEFEPQPSL